MTHRNHAASDVLDRWHMLKEHHLEHLTELFESGRWRRYHGERSFLKNIKEAKQAVETWPRLAAPKLGAPRPVRRKVPTAMLQFRKVETGGRDRPVVDRTAPSSALATETKIMEIEETVALVSELFARKRALEVPDLDLAAIERVIRCCAMRFSFIVLPMISAQMLRVSREAKPLYTLC